MSNVFDLHPSLSKPETLKADVPGGYVVNIAGVIQMAREGDTPECRALVRFFSAEYRAISAQPLSDAAREWAAFQAAWGDWSASLASLPLARS